jgi:hypothetical protein
MYFSLRAMKRDTYARYGYACIPYNVLSMSRIHVGELTLRVNSTLCRFEAINRANAFNSSTVPQDLGIFV